MVTIRTSCPQGCTTSGPTQSCLQGTQLWAHIDEVLRLTRSEEFYAEPASVRRGVWDRFNLAANTYLEHIRFQVEPPDYRNMHRDYKMQKFCQRCQDLTTWILWLHPTRGTMLWCGTCKQKEDLRVSVRIWKIERAQTEKSPQIDQVLSWVREERQTFTELDESIDYWQGAFPLLSPESRAYSLAYGVLLADHFTPYQPSSSSTN